MRTAASGDPQGTSPSRQRLNLHDHLIERGLGFGREGALVEGEKHVCFFDHSYVGILLAGLRERPAEPKMSPAS
jgi:hypothetical protein